MSAGAGAIWPVMVGVAAAFALWMRTSRAPTDRTADRLTVGAVALVCVTAVAVRTTGHAIVALPLAVAGSAAACVDAREGRLPDVLTLPLLPATLIAVGTAAHDFAGSDVTVGTALVGSLLAAAVGLLAALVVKLVSDAVVGWGDVKLAPTLAVVVSQGGSASGFALIAALGVASTALLVRRSGRRRGVRGDGDDRTTEAVVPYGPALVLGALFAAGPG
ncbi:MAG: prepilin peptidase [Pseudonocardiales bacterium]|jgi:leader peptidase (prepilin peptidase) / N-methyltransferase|nr:prepilin peptidase [Pseudonocardiales bacterium]